MLTRLLQALAITSAVYLMMITHQSPRSQSAFLIKPHSTAVGTARFSQLVAEMLDFLITPTQRHTQRHRANVTVE